MLTLLSQFAGPSDGSKILFALKVATSLSAISQGPFMTLMHETDWRPWQVY